MIRIGTLDRITNIIGERGMGKSTKAVLDAREFQRTTGGFVVGHSPNGQLGFTDIEGEIIFYDSLEDLEAGLQKNPHSMHFIATGATPEEVIDFGRALAKALRKKGHEAAGVKFQENRPAPPGVMAAPVLIIIDEGTHTDQSKRMRKDEGQPITTADLKELEKFLTSARHENVAVTFLIQAPTSRSWVYMEQGNIFYVFRYTHEWGANAVRAAGIPKEEIPRIKVLKRFRYYVYFKMYPEEGNYKDLPKPE